MLEHYLQMFAKLLTNRGRDRYPEITYHRAPHKPFLVLSVMDLIAQGRISQNLIEPSYELVDTFNTYWVAIMPPGSITSMGIWDVIHIFIFVEMISLFLFKPLPPLY